ncbi:MAG: hypothetical protein WCS98_01320 [Bacillota bacterium]|jgi:hypothetical protein|nr:hypothetical protein [Bacillota bacterium]MDD3297569.1 hypothetical protein [Bacillota bacterium]MDD3850182.1 hypothetical protein [Bacillota bacterium]MDD4707274.1 hypothetical protein [Bacillota bacterium]
MDTVIKETILAIVTTDRERVIHSAAPVFYAGDEEERERVALLLSKVTLGMVHDLENGCLIIVKH